jgi:hypothetical protein
VPQRQRRIGIYWVDKYVADPRGGVYFRTGTGVDGFGPDVMSYGFAYRPNADGSPFGGARYGRWRLFGDWYWFRASDDSYQWRGPAPRPYGHSRTNLDETETPPVTGGVSVCAG